MSAPPEFEIDLAAFATDPYPIMARLRATAPVATVPQLGGVVFSRRNDIATLEKQIEIFSSQQPGGLMDRLMGRNMMRQDGPPHASERKAIFPTVSPRTARDTWTARFRAHANALLDTIASQDQGDLLNGFARPLSGEALKEITGLTHVPWSDIDRWSQAMIDGIANYIGDPEPEARCKAAVAEIDDAIAGAPPSDAPNLINTQNAAGLSPVRRNANIRLAISGGQNESRDAIGGLLWALLTHPDQLDLIQTGAIPISAAFDEFVRWISPIGMSPRRIARDQTVLGFDLKADTRAFFLFSAANRDPDIFEQPDKFDITRDASRHIAFGAGPHFCAGAPAARALVADVALPALLDRLPNLRLNGPVAFHGWAFRGPDQIPCAWSTP